jgi:hypothetical protein
LALFVALGAGGHAKKVVHLIDGSTIKRGTIRVDRVSTRAERALRGSTGP